MNDLEKAHAHIKQMKESGMAMLKTETERTRQVIIMRGALVEIAEKCKFNVVSTSASTIHEIAATALAQDFGPLREGDGDYSGDPQKDWDQFWSEIVAPDGQVDIEQVKKELSDFRMLMKFIPEVYMHATGGMCSYAHTMPATVCSLIDNHIAFLTDGE